MVQLHDIVHHYNLKITNKYHGLLGDKYIYEGSDGETESDGDNSQQTSSKNRKNNK